MIKKMLSQILDTSSKAKLDLVGIGGVEPPLGNTLPPFCPCIAVLHSRATKHY